MNKWYGGNPARDSVETTPLTNEEISELNLWIYDNPRYQAMSWSEQVALFLYEKYRKEAA